MMAEGHIGRPVFCDSDGKHLRRPNFGRRIYKPLLERAGLPAINFHALRHTTATVLLAAGEHLKVVSELLGHSTIQTTLSTYTHVLPGMQRAAADRLDRIFA